MVPQCLRCQIEIHGRDEFDLLTSRNSVSGLAESFSSPSHHCPFIGVFLEKEFQATEMLTQRSEKIVIASESSRRWMIQERSLSRQGWQHSEAVIGQRGQDPLQAFQAAHPLLCRIASHDLGTSAVS